MADEKDKAVKSTLVTEIMVGDDLFRSSGYSFIKITKAGEASVLQLPIRSGGVNEVIERMRDKEPKAPSKPVYIYADSPEGKAMKLSRNQWVHMPDVNDEGYLTNSRAFNEELSWAITLQALDVRFKDKDGTVILEDAQKIEVLKNMGISSNQLTQLVTDVNDLTALTDRDRERFFENNSGGTARVLKD